MIDKGRIIADGDSASQRLQRVLEITQRSPEDQKRGVARHQDIADLEHLP
jgi:hypothetical protein